MTEPTELVASLRNLIEVVRTVDFDDAADGGVELGSFVTQLRDMTARLTPYVVDEVRMQAGLHSSHVPGGTPGSLPDLTGVDPQAFFPYSPVIGALNPVSPPFRLWKEGDVLRGQGSFGAASNGPPGAVHGGHVAALMDEVLGVTGVVTGNHGFTGTLTVRYLAPTPLDTELTVRGWVDRTEGRKAFICGELFAGASRCATAEGVFIQPRPQA